MVNSTYELFHLFQERSVRLSFISTAYLREGLSIVLSKSLPLRNVNLNSLKIE